MYVFGIDFRRQRGHGAIMNSGKDLTDLDDFVLASSADLCEFISIVLRFISCHLCSHKIWHTVFIPSDCPTSHSCCKWTLRLNNIFTSIGHSALPKHQRNQVFGLCQLIYVTDMKLSFLYLLNEKWWSLHLSIPMTLN